MTDWVKRLGERRHDGQRGLDVATGRGRHAIVLARAGVHTFAVDRSFEAVRAASSLATAQGLSINAWCADLTTAPLPRSYFDIIVVARYLERALFDALGEALRPGGTLLYETFTTQQPLHGRGPTSPDHLLRPGELLTAFPGLDVIVYEEVGDPDAVGRLVARRPRRR
ncbi:MAG: class I SAM-dependent methyltransferase [Vicinamibacterales bacterium]